MVLCAFSVSPFFISDSFPTAPLVFVLTSVRAVLWDLTCLTILFVALRAQLVPPRRNASLFRPRQC